MIDSRGLVSGVRALGIIGGIPSASVAEIRVEDERVDLHIGRRAHGDRRPAIENDHRDRKAA